ncbi:MAG TPA: outer membrane beta-barrel protein [Flavobacterium sp.]|jgi:hypothetical protein
MRQLIILLLLSGISAFGQPAKSEPFEINGLLRFELVKPIAFGDNALAKAHQSVLGLGVGIGIFRYQNFRLGYGYHFSRYNITDQTLTGNMDHTNYSSHYGAISYEFPAADKITVTPEVGFGQAQLKQAYSGTRYSYQKGSEFRLGARGNFYLTESTSAYVSLQYVHANLQIETAPEYVDFFGRAQQLQLAVGIQFD